MNSPSSYKNRYLRKNVLKTESETPDRWETEGLKLAKTPIDLVTSIEKVLTFIQKQNNTPEQTNFLEDGLPDAYYNFNKSELRDLQTACREHKLEVVLETPRGWMNGGGNSKFTRSLYMNISMMLNQLGIPTVGYVVTKEHSFLKRNVNSNQLCFAFHSADRELKENTSIIRIKESYLPPYYTFDATGFSGWAQLANDSNVFLKCLERDKVTAMRFVTDLRKRIFKNKVSKYAQPENYKRPTNTPFVFHPMQIDSDPVVMEHSYIPHRTLLENLIKLALETKVPLVIKRHPRCPNREIEKLLGELSARQSPLIIITDTSVIDLIRDSQAVVVINSGAGMEALVQGKPVYAAGHSEYSYVCHRVSEERDLKNAFLDPKSKTDPVTLAKFIDFYFNEYCVNASDPRHIQSHILRAIKRWATTRKNFN
jgi:hypothetical protein